MRTKALASGVVLALIANVGTALADDDFSTLKGIDSVPMTAQELDGVKGLHFHFVTAAGKELLVNVQQGKDGFNPTPNPDEASDFPFIVGKGYRGLCGAALNAVGLAIPGQDLGTGVGGGC